MHIVGMSAGLEKNSVRQALAEHPFFRDFPVAHMELLVEAAMLKVFRAGEVIFKEGDPANRFYILQSGEVQLESETADGRVIPLQRIGAGDVLGWSWLFPPYYWHFGARALDDTKAIFLYGTWLRESCERDHDFGYAMLKRMAAVAIQRLQATRKRLAELEQKT